MVFATKKTKNKKGLIFGMVSLLNFKLSSGVHNNLHKSPENTIWLERKS